MDEYYKDKLETGLEFQDHVIDSLLKEVGLVISPYSSRRYQRKKGESAQGIEIKFDMEHEKTGNLFIETEEKTSPDKTYWTPSGIYRDDNSWLYVIGNYSVLYIFDKKWLRRLCESGKYPVFEIKRGTSRGFLLKQKEQDLSMKIMRQCKSGDGQRKEYMR